MLDEGLTLGDAARQAKASITDADVRRSWILFGDPSQSLPQFSKRQGGLTLTPGPPAACTVAQGSTGPFSFLLPAAAALLLLRRRQSGSLAKRANPTVRSGPPA